MWLLLIGLWSRVQGWMVAVGAVVAGLGAAYLAGRRGASNAAAARALGKALENRETRDAVDRTVAREREPVERLRSRWSRD